VSVTANARTVDATTPVLCQRVHDPSIAATEYEASALLPRFDAAHDRRCVESDDLPLDGMHLLGRFTNPSAPLAAVFEALPDKPLEPIEHPEPELAMGRLGNGVVQRAIVKVLASADGPMRLRDIHAAVEDVLGQVVSKESVSWCLRMSKSGAGLRFERVAFGSYRLMSQT
jgi:hypothetical protein